MSKIVILSAFIVSIIIISGLNSDFNSYYNGRSNFIFVADPPDSYVGYTNTSFYVDRCDYEPPDIELQGVLISLINNLPEVSEIQVSFEEWIGQNGDITVTMVDPDFILIPGESRDIYGSIYIDSLTSEGNYSGVFFINAIWNNGSAEIYTISYPLELRITDRECGNFNSIGYWKNHPGTIKEEYLGIIENSSSIFNETMDLNSLSDVEAYLNPPHPPSMEDRAYQQLTASWLNFAFNKDVGLDAWNLWVDINGDGILDTTFGEAIMWAETNITSANYEVAKDICDSMNNM